MSTKKSKKRQVKKPKISEQKKAELKRLRKEGLYKPENPRAAPTKYGLSLLRKFGDFLSGKADVVTVPKTKNSKGYKQAREAAKSGIKARAVRNKIVVPKQEGETVAWDKGLKTFVTERWDADRTTRYTRRPLGRRVTDPRTVKIKANERISIPFNRGWRGIEWMNLTYDDFLDDWQIYKIDGTYKTMGDHIFIFSVEQEGFNFEEGREMTDEEKQVAKKKKRKPAKRKKKKTTKRKK